MRKDRKMSCEEKEGKNNITKKLASGKNGGNEEKSE